MTFTTDLTTDIGKTRLELGDDSYTQGVKPDETNLTDEEIQVYLDREGSVMRAVAGCCEMLARRWSLVSDISIGPRRESFSQISQRWAAQGAQLRKLYGGAGGVISASPSRQDGFADEYGTTDDYA